MTQTKRDDLEAAAKAGDARKLFVKTPSDDFGYWSTEVSSDANCRTQYGDFKDSVEYIEALPVLAKLSSLEKQIKAKDARIVELEVELFHSQGSVEHFEKTRQVWIDRCEQKGQRISELQAELDAANAQLAHRHIIGKSYDVTAENINKLAGELEEMKEENADLKQKLEKVEKQFKLISSVRDKDQEFYNELIKAKDEDFRLYKQSAENHFKVDQGQLNLVYKDLKNANQRIEQLEAALKDACEELSIRMEKNSEPVPFGGSHAMHDNATPSFNILLRAQQALTKHGGKE